jgi:hypothetical protein
MTRVTIYLKENPAPVVFKTYESPGKVRDYLIRSMGLKSVFHYTATNNMVILHPDSIAGILIEDV